MAEIIDDIKVSSVEITKNTSIVLSGENPNIVHKSYNYVDSNDELTIKSNILNVVNTRNININSIDNLISDTGNISIETGASNGNEFGISGDTGNISIKTGYANFSKSGNIEVSCGAGTIGGNMILKSGNSSNNNGGNITVQTGSGSLGNGGDFLLTTGTCFNGNSGNITLTCGNANGYGGYTGAIGGKISLISGNALVPSSFGGDILIQCGNADSSTNGTGGNLEIYSGKGNTGGNIKIASGEKKGVNSNTGSYVEIKGGYSYGSGRGGPVNIYGGISQSGLEGDINLTGTLINLTGGIIAKTPQSLTLNTSISQSGSINLTSLITFLNLTGGSGTSTLTFDGTPSSECQIKIIAVKSIASGSQATLSLPFISQTITFNSLAQSITLIYSSSGWILTSSVP